MSFLRNLFQRRAAFPPPIKTDGNTPLALHFDSRGQIRPITLKSLTGGYDNFYGTTLNSGIAMTHSEQGYAVASMVNVWVGRCLDIRADAINRLDWYVEDKRTHKRIEQHPLEVAIKTSPHHLMKRIIRSRDLWGETFLYPYDNLFGYCTGIQWLNNLTTQIIITQGYINSFQYVPIQGGRAHTFARDEIAYLHTFNPFNDLRGASLLTRVLEDAQVGEEISSASKAFYENGAQPGVMLILDQDMNSPEAQSFIDYWKKNFGGSRNTNKPVLIPRVIKDVKVLERAEIADDVTLRESTRREICAGFGVPLSIAGAWDDANYQSAPEQRKSLYEETVFPLADDVAQELTNELLPFFDSNPDSAVTYDASAVMALIENREQQVTSLNSQLVSGGISLNEYREQLDLPELPNGNVYYIPAGVLPTPASQLGIMQPKPSYLPYGNPQTTIQQSQFIGTEAGIDVPNVPPPETNPEGEAPVNVTGNTNNAAPNTTPPVATEDTTKAGNELALLLTLPNNPDLVALQSRVRDLLSGVPIEWNAPGDFHITLLYAPACDDDQMQMLLALLPEVDIPALTLNVGSLSAFDTIGSHALHFRVRRNADLLDLQETLYDLARQCGIQTSSYSVPGAYVPHITIGYAEQKVKPVTFSSKLTVQPQTVKATVKQDDGYKTLYERPIVADAAPASTGTKAALLFQADVAYVDEAPPTSLYRCGNCRWYSAMPGTSPCHLVVDAPLPITAYGLCDRHELIPSGSTVNEWVENEETNSSNNERITEEAADQALADIEAQFDELAAWEKFHHNRRGKTTRAFECHVLPADVQLVVTTALQAGAESTAFAVARDYVRFKADPPEELPEDPFVTEEQAQAWWQDYDALMAQIGTEWLNEYMATAWQQLGSSIQPDMTPELVTEALAQQHDSIVELWTGTPEEPGTLAKLIFAGMGAGQRALEDKRTDLNPAKASLDVDWSLIPEDVIDFVREYTFSLIRRIDGTTVDLVQKALEAWVTAGGTLADLTSAMQSIFNNPVRAQLIAQTESTRAYQEGAERRWQDAGVKKAKWRTVMDNHVCPTCKALHGKVASLVEGWYYGGKYYRPPAHPNCRCYSAPEV